MVDLNKPILGAGPSGATGAVRYGGFWRRFLAYILDYLVVFVPLFFVSLFAGLGSTAVDGLDAVSGGLNLLGLVAGWLYFALMESSARQATLGKMALGLIVTDQAGGRISFGRATGRFFGKILSGLILAIGYLMIAFTARKQGLHDMLASTLVLHGRPNAATADVFS